ncbi:MAG: lipid-A-disaccharide synthase [Henriciella sp.]|nr:lipid-A-disaccharide synthase [Henriciella sp.]
MTAPRIYMVAAEASGDLLARETVEALKELSPHTKFAGIGGGELAKVGIVSPIDVSPLSIVGIFDGLKIYGTVLKLVDAAVADIIAFNPDTVVLVDSWGFMIRIAERLKEQAPQIKIVKLVGPQVWATRAGRAKKLAAVVDHLVCLHAMEVPYYEPFGLPVTVMGSPALSRTDKGDGAKFRGQYGFSDTAKLLLVLPGSRPSEIRRVAPALIEAAKLTKEKFPEVHVVILPAASIREPFLEQFPYVTEWATITDTDQSGPDAMAAADYALACSGTVTSELAVQGTPFQVAYKAGWMTWAIARFFLYKPTHITLLNIAADDTEIAPEYLQTTLRPDVMSEEAVRILKDEAARYAQIDAQNKALSRMGEGDEKASKIAARAILRVASNG